MFKTCSLTENNLVTLKSVDKITAHAKWDITFIFTTKINISTHF